MSVDFSAISGFGFDVPQSEADRVIKQSDYDDFEEWVAEVLLADLDDFACDWYGNMYTSDEGDDGYLFTFKDEDKLAAFLRGESQKLPDFELLLKAFKKHLIQPKNKKAEWLCRECVT